MAGKSVARWTVLLGLGVWLGLWVATPGQAELYRCTGPDGKTYFTDRAERCPGAQPHQSSGRVQSILTQPAAVPQAEDPDVPASLERELAASEEARWRDKKVSSERELVAVSETQERLEWAVSKCNRGNKLYVKNSNGLKSGLSCVKIRAQLVEVRSRQEQLQAYVNGGLEQECRRSGCLPGWVR